MDWLSYTAPIGAQLADALPGADRLEWVELPRGGYGYRRAMACGHVTAYTDGGSGDRMGGWHIQISGQGARELEAAGVVQDWAAFLGMIRGQGWGVSRLDVAMDDHAGVLDLDTIEAAIGADQVVSRWRQWSVMRSGGRGLRDGKSIRFGSPTSDARVRIYDKAAEQAVDGHWVRVELILRDARAEAMASALAADPSGRVAVGVLRGYIEFRDTAVVAQRERAPVLAWWDQFCAGIARMRLGRNPAPPRTVEEVKRWIAEQVAPSLAVVLKADQGDLSWLLAVTRGGQHRWRDQHRRMLAGAGIAA